MADQSKDALIIDPQTELRFVGPFNRHVTTIMNISNPTQKTFLFKIKTTAPKRYCVRPNFGSLGPSQSATVEITLQPFEFESKEKNRHKFMVQSLECPSGVEMDANLLWKDADPNQLGDTKLKCVFEMPEVAMKYDSNAPSAKVEKDKNSSPKSGAEEEAEPFSKASVDVSNELRVLREEISDLRKQNLSLKEQMLRQRSTQYKQSDEPYAPVAVEKQIPMFYIAVAIAAVIFGLLLGKYLL